MGTVKIKIRNDQRIRLAKTLYILKLGVNLLFDHKLYKLELKRSWDQNELYLYNKNNKEIFEVLKYGGIYIIDRIIKDFFESAFKIIIRN